jgi:NAD(P)-dependent dehydrogenase (short-subunit alcohol dehydrogenase family)
MRLKNKFAVIIGGAVGIGAAITERFAKEGCDLFITFHGDREELEAQKLEKRIKEFNTKFSYENLDVLKKEQIKKFFEKIKKSADKLDIAVNNAGVSSMKNFIDLTEEDWDFNMDINAKGMFFCCQEEAKIMIGQNYGKIINTASLAAKIGAIFLAHYAASKFAVLGLTFTMAVELSKYNINVNAVCPGIVLTDMIKREWEWESKLRGIDKDEFVKNWQESIPLRRFATPKDIANMFFFLASEDSNYITGQAFNVNGGSENH